MVVDDGKLVLIEEYFKDIEARIEYLDELVANNHVDEAFLLCSVYIESLANRYYQDYGSAKGFCLALIELTGNELFSLIHPRQLLNKLASNKLFDKNINDVSGLLNSLQDELQTLDAIKEHLKEILIDEQKVWLNEHWLKGSMAMIVYERIRCDAVHDMYATKLSFGNTQIKGRPVPDIDYDLLRSALGKVVSFLKEKSLSDRTLFLQHNAN